MDEKLLGLGGHEDTEAERGAVGREANVSARIHARPRGILGALFASNAGSVAKAGDVSYQVPLSTPRAVA
ncbi:hypothetical protein [Sorangium sp. So ce1000]|uniref:hypothetical protein n=1 Tax=Sorangium sp. So ce1000 TaxID=3133325 RepID=UPI003F6167E2